MSFNILYKYGSKLFDEESIARNTHTRKIIKKLYNKKQYKKCVKFIKENKDYFCKDHHIICHLIDYGLNYEDIYIDKINLERLKRLINRKAQIKSQLHTQLPQPLINIILNMLRLSI
jgi:hypothetical protein